MTSVHLLNIKCVLQMCVYLVYLNVCFKLWPVLFGEQIFLRLRRTSFTCVYFEIHFSLGTGYKQLSLAHVILI